MNTFISSIAALGAIGAVFGIALEFASNVFYVEVDDRIMAVDDALPGANCGACGFPGCMGLAEAIVAGNAPVTACPVGGQESAEAISEIMGLNAGEVEKEVARVICNGTCNNAKEQFKFIGIEDCRERNAYYSGNKDCTYGCLSGGTCAVVCPFDAIVMENGIPIIDKDKCTACNICIETCPKNIIELVPYKSKTVIECSSNDAGKDVRQSCKVGCIGCSLCVKKCPVEAIEITDMLAKIDYEKCVNCGMCVDVCPMKTIHAEYKTKAQRDAEKAATEQLEVAE